MNRHAAKLVASVACLGLLTAGCEPRGGNATGGTKTLKLAFVTNNSADFWTIARRGVEKADAELADVETEFRITADGTAAEQQRIVDDLLTKGVHGIAISPVDPDNQGPLIDAASKRAVVFTQDSDAPQSSRTCYIGTDNLAAGRQAGEARRRPTPDVRPDPDRGTGEHDTEHRLPGQPGGLDLGRRQLDALVERQDDQ